MVFIHPSWFEGTIIWLLYFLPVFICVGLIIVAIFKVFLGNLNGDNEEKWLKVFIGSLILTVILVIACEGIGGYLWHQSYEIPSVSEKVVTVAEWQVKPNEVHTENGVMVIDNADQLMMVTDTGEGFVNNENFLFQKFDTRDILNSLKPGGTYKIKYYGWREGYNSGFPNILSVEEVVDESNVTNVSLSDYFGTKLSIG